MPDASKARKEIRKLGVRAARSGSLYVAGQVAASLSVLIMLVLLARFLQPSLFGLYAIIVAFYSLLGTFAQFSMGTAVRKKVPELKDRKQRSVLISNAYAIATTIAIVIAIAGILLSGDIATHIYHQPSIATPLALASVLVVFWMLFNLTSAVLVGLDKVKEATIIDLVYSVLQPIAAVGLVYLGFGVLGAIAGITFSIIVGSALGLFYLSKQIDNLIIKPTKKVIKELMEFATPVATSNIALLGPPYFAILLLGVYAASSVVGNYNAGYELGNFVGIIFSSTTFVLLPFFASTFAKKETSSHIGKMFNGSIYYTLLFLLPMLAYTIGVAQPIMYLLFSKVYAMTPFYFMAIALGTALGIFGVYAGTLIVSYGNTKRFMLYQLVVVAIELALLFILTPVLKGIGVLISIFLVGPIALDLIYVWVLRRQFTFKTEFGGIISLIFAAIITFAVLYGITYLLHQSKIAIIVDLLLAVLIYVPLVIMSGCVGQNELDFIKTVSDSYKLGFIAKYILDYAQFFIQYKNKKTSSP